MHWNPDSILMLADIRHRELQDEAARIWFVQETHGSSHAALSITAVSEPLRLALVGASRLLRALGLLQVHPRHRAEAG